MSPNSSASKKSFLHSPSAYDLSVAELLKTRREELKESLKDVEKSTQIRKRYLELIEAGDYEHLPDNVYSLGYVKSYADHLGFDTAPIVNLYKKERMSYKESRNSGDVVKDDKQMGLQPLGRASFVLSTKSLLIVTSVLLFAVILIYLGWQVAVLASPPKITLNNIQDQVATNYVIISGQTNGDADVFIDNSPILTNPDGSFSERVALLDGQNQITVTAKNQLGKSTSVTKIVTASLPSTAGATTQVSPTPVDGVEMLVKISNQATWIIVISDGQTVFRGTMLPGASQIFKAKSSIVLTTGNAGNTQVFVSNAVVASKDLGTLGKPGEAKNDLEFNKDTQFK